ncbi:hypothetical protein M3603_15485 [Rummeliibacillus stabekisii]|uniref:hypothetical protein n=1 Tax=Rummeliibacillus stabekisii TaxID=241244 RepID=UPI00203FCF08|nr:hypothetical protein [Rummeliibacillus stabekisii]MCM3318020.1 hypothetical protein [Rummeliibacillus stabekisii]
MDFSVAFIKLDFKCSRIHFQISVKDVNGFCYYLSDKLKMYPLYIGWDFKRKWWKSYYEPDITIGNELLNSSLITLNDIITLNLPQQLCENIKNRDYFCGALLTALYEWIRDEYNTYLQKGPISTYEGALQ